MKKIIIILGISLIHFAICFLALVTTPMIAKSEEPFSPFPHGTLGSVLFFPLSLFKTNFEGNYVPISYTVANSVFCGVCVFGLYYWLSFSRRNRSA